MEERHQDNQVTIIDQVHHSDPPVQCREECHQAGPQVPAGGLQPHHRAGDGEGRGRLHLPGGVLLRPHPADDNTERPHTCRGPAFSPVRSIRGEVGQMV